MNAGCTVAMYPGPKRPATETAQIVASGESSVRNIDGTELPVGLRFTVLPGLHAVTVDAVGAPAPGVAAAGAPGGPAAQPLVRQVLPWTKHPGTGPAVELGAFAGGTNLAVGMSNGQMRNTISGGSGVLLGVGWLWTPLWAGDGLGLGLDAELGLKYDQATGNGYKASFRRFPVALAAHTFLRAHSVGLVFAIHYNL